jgi:hypothetical protein
MSALQRVFRPTPKYWLNEVLSPAFVLAGLALFFLLINGDSSRTLAILFGLGVLLFIPSAVQTVHTRLEMDEIGMRGLYRKRPFDYPWSEVLVVRRVMGVGKKWYLQIGVDAGVYEFPLEQFDVEAVWQWLETTAPSRVLADDAFEQLSWAKSQREATAALLAGATGPVFVRIAPWIAGVGWVAAAFLAFMIILALRSGAWDAVLLLFLACVVVAGYLIWAGSSIIEIEREAIRVVMPLWPTYGINWNEVEHIEIDHGLSQFVLYGKGKRMTVPGPAYWRAADRGNAIHAFSAHLEHRGISLDYKARAAFALPKGVRTPRDRR